MSQHLFDEFPPVSKEEWIEKIKKDLKGKAIEQLNWQIDDELKISPFVSRSDLKNIPEPLVKQTAGWHTGETILVSEIDDAHLKLKTALSGGVDSPCLKFSFLPTDDDLDNLFAEIDLSIVHFHVKQQFHSNWAGFMDLLIRYFEKNKLDKSKLKGVFHINSDLFATDISLDSIYSWQKHFPSMTFFNIDGKDREEHLSICEHLADKLMKGALLLEAISEFEKPLLPFCFELSVGKNYFLEIAKLRAFRILWANILKANDFDAGELPYIDCYFDKSSQTENQNDNIISAATMAMSSIIGGASRLTVMPSNNENGQSDDFTTRIARNVQHLLKWESHFDKVHDPASGSYYVETLTNKIIDICWKHFQKKMA